MPFRHGRCAADGFPGWVAGLAVVIAMLLAPDAKARNVIVTLDTGRELAGELIEEDDDRVVIEIAGIRTALDRERVVRVDDQPAPEEVYRERRAELPDDDLIGRAALVREMIDLNAYDLAEQELAALRERFPEQQRPLDRLDRLIDARRTLRDQPAADAVEVDEPPVVAGPGERMTESQLNRIRVYEVNLAEQPRVQVPRAVIDRLFVEHAGDDRLPRGRNAAAQVRRRPGHEQLALLFDVQARELYGDVIVRQDPSALRGFRNQIHRQYVLNYCATAECHGGEQSPGDLFLFRTHANTERTVYTNFYILDDYARDGARMIDRASPERSLLIQHGLARQAAIHAHPDVPGWRPQFRSTEDIRAQRFADVIRELYRPRPDYGIDYTPPLAAAEPDAAVDDAPDHADDAAPADHADDAPSDAPADAPRNDAPANDETRDAPEPYPGG